MKFFRTYNRHRLTVIFLIGILLVTGIYGYLKTRDLIRGPEIDLRAPTPGATYTEELAVVKGKAERISRIYLNDRQIFTDPEGNFSEPLLLFPGYNILTLRAHDAFGREIRKTVELFYQS